MRAVHDRGSDKKSARERLLALYAYNYIELARDAGQMILPGSVSVLLREQVSNLSVLALPLASGSGNISRTKCSAGSGPGASDRCCIEADTFG